MVRLLTLTLAWLGSVVYAEPFPSEYIDPTLFGDPPFPDDEPCNAGQGGGFGYGRCKDGQLITPEPSRVTLLFVGIMALVTRRKRRRK